MSHLTGAFQIPTETQKDKGNSGTIKNGNRNL